MTHVSRCVHGNAGRCDEYSCAVERLRAAAWDPLLSWLARVLARLAAGAARVLEHFHRCWSVK